MAMDFYTPSEVAKLLRVPPRRVLELLDVGEIEAERDTRTGRWRVPKGSLNASETERLTELLTEGEDELRARLRTTEEALSALEERARALRKERDRLGEERDRLRVELEAERTKGFWRRLFGG
jgi:excisionase family DNA binding protein